MKCPKCNSDQLFTDSTGEIQQFTCLKCNFKWGMDEMCGYNPDVMCEFPPDCDISACYGCKHNPKTRPLAGPGITGMGGWGE